MKIYSTGYGDGFNLKSNQSQCRYYYYFTIVESKIEGPILAQGAAISFILNGAKLAAIFKMVSPT